jgi:hypothetical protein
MQLAAVPMLLAAALIYWMGVSYAGDSSGGQR